MGSKIKAIIFIAVFLLAIAVIFSALSNRNAEIKASEEQTPLPEGVEAVAVPTAPPPDPSAVPTPVPTIYIPEATTIPTPSPTPAPSALSSGSFKSNTETGLNMIVEYSAEALGDGTSRVNVTVRIEHFAWHYNGYPSAITVTVGNETVYFSSPTVNSDTLVMETEDLGTKSVTLPQSGGTINLKAVWTYGGQYSEKQLDIVSCEGLISLG